MLEEYGDALRLRLKTGRLTLRSLRLALTPAAGLLEVAAGRQRLPPDQKTLEAFLRETPGQWAPVNGFVTHLRRTQGAELTMPKRRAFQRARETAAGAARRDTRCGQRRDDRQTLGRTRAAVLPRCPARKGEEGREQGHCVRCRRDDRRDRRPGTTGFPLSQASALRQQEAAAADSAGPASSARHAVRRRTRTTTHGPRPTCRETVRRCSGWRWMRVDAGAAPASSARGRWPGHLRGHAEPAGEPDADGRLRRVGRQRAGGRGLHSGERPR